MAISRVEGEKETEGNRREKEGGKKFEVYWLYFSCDFCAVARRLLIQASGFSPFSLLKNKDKNKKNTLIFKIDTI